MMPSSELIKILRTGAQGLDCSVRFMIFDACDRLERQIRDNELLMQKIVELRSRGKWIPVTERLPEIRVPVLTLGRKGAVGIGFIQPTSVTADGKVYFYPRYGDSLPTHWMPLPEPPKGE